MCSIISLLVVLYFVSGGELVPVSIRDKQSPLNSRPKDDHGLDRLSFGSVALHNGLGNEVSEVDSSFLPRTHPIHSYLPYPPNHHGPLPGPYPPPFGHSHQPFPGQVPSDEDNQHHGCGGHPCKHGTGFNHYPGYDPHHNHYNHGYNKGFVFHVCEYPDHKHMKPHYHPDNDVGKEPVTDIPPIENTVSTIRTPSTKPPTKSSTTTTTEGPTYNIDIRYGNR